MNKIESTKMNFLTRIKKAIFKFDEYEKFITEPTKKAIGYFTKIIVVFSVIVSIVLTYQMSKETKNILEIVDKEFPEFTIINNELEIEERFEYYFEDLRLNVIMNENSTNLEDNNTNSLALLTNKMIIKYNGFSQEVFYKDIQNQSISKENIVRINKTKDWILVCISMCAIMVLISFIVYSIIILIDVITLAILGLIINLLIRTAFKFRALFIISVYSMTLPIILYLIYIVVNILFGTTIKYFEIAYNAIAYIYLITVLLMIKSDIIKNTQELQKILEEQKKVKEELEREKQEEKEKQEEANRDSQREKKKKEKAKDEPEVQPQAEN